MLKENYSSKIQDSKEKKQEMVKFFDAMKTHSDPQQEQKMRLVLNGGRGDIKRHYAVDEKLYGTEEGAKMAEEAMKKSSMSKKKKKKNKSEKVVTEKVSDDESDATLIEKPLLVKISSRQKTACGIAAVALVGGGISILFGSKRSR